MIVGAGLGGLTLAQALRGSGFHVRVDERDASPTTRGQGYRISLNETGVRALERCLPRELFDLVHATSLRQATRMIFMDRDLRPSFTKDLPVPRSRSLGFGVHRQTLREILLVGVEDSVRFGHAFDRYERLPDGVRARFTDGSSAEGDLLVGADGTNSAVRRQLLPGATHDQLGRALYGRTPIRDDTVDRLPAELVDSFNRVTGPDGIAMSVATCRTREPISRAVATYAPGARITDLPDCLTWTISLPDDRLRDAPPPRLHEHAVDLADRLHPALRRIVTEAEVDATFLVAIRSANPVEPWDEPSVTLLGDAVHTMSPGRGEGANIALRDADTLAAALRRAPDGVEPDGLSALVRDYERWMLDYGFASVTRSRRRPFAPHQPSPQ